MLLCVSHACTLFLSNTWAKNSNPNGDLRVYTNLVVHTHTMLVGLVLLQELRKKLCNKMEYAAGSVVMWLDPRR